MKVLLIFAHPDDETIVVGGTVAKLSKKHTVKLLCATKGEAGLTGNPPVTTKKNLGSVREQELRKAAHELGIKEIAFLGLIDGTLHKNKKKITSLVEVYLKKENPDVIITFNNQGGWSHHPDHVAISECATDAVKKYAGSAKKHIRLYHSVTPKSEFQKIQKYIFSFGKIDPTPDELVTTVVDISKTLQKKLKAVSHHKTQHQDYERLQPYLSKANKEFYSLVFENSVI